MDATPQNIVLGVKRKPEINPTNWEFDKLPKCKATVEMSLPRQWSLKDKFPHVYRQVYGSCTANAVLACDAYYYHSDKWNPSGTFTYYNSRKLDGCAKDPDDDGSSVETALNAVRKFGACNVKVWPNEEPFTKKPSAEAYADGLKGHEVTKYYRVKTLGQIKKALYNGYPVVIAVAWCFKSIDGNTFIMNTPTKKEIKNAESGHAIVLVGYDDDKQLFEFRNSWSELWGNKGYAYFTSETLKNVIWFEDSYAVVK